MSLQQQLSQGGLRLRWARADALCIGETTLVHSVLLDAERWQPWAPDRFEVIDASCVDALLAASPELVLLGTGARQRFLAPALQARLLGRGIGIECMDNAAAARTYNLLADEGRRVLAAFLIESA